MKLGPLISSLRTAYAIKLERFTIKASTYNTKLCIFLIKHGYVYSYTALRRILVVHLKFTENQPSMRGCRLISKPSHRVYLKKRNVKGLAIYGYYKNAYVKLVSTSSKSGLLTDLECALLGIGGKALAALG